MKQILIATHNPGKFKELSHGLNKALRGLVEAVSLAKINIKDAPEETGKTFKENAKLKAIYYAKKSHLPTIADDGGLVIPALNNEPGVRSRRWLGRQSTDDELIKYTLLKMIGQSKTKRRAYLEVCLCFYNPKTKEIYFSAKKNWGHIAEKPLKKYTAGYPFRALLVLHAFGKYYDELTPSEHERFNHRLLALNRLIPKIKKDLLQ